MFKAGNPVNLIVVVVYAKTLVFVRKDISAALQFGSLETIINVPSFKLSSQFCKRNYCCWVTVLVAKPNSGLDCWCWTAGALDCWCMGALDCWCMGAFFTLLTPCNFDNFCFSPPTDSSF